MECDPIKSMLSQRSMGSSFAQPVKGRGGKGLTRVRGGRVGPSHSR